MKNKNLLILSLVLLLSLSMSAQGLINNTAARNRILATPLFQENLDLKAFYETVTGSPYIYDALLPAKVNDYKDIVSARYDAYKDVITIQINDSKIFYLEKKLGNQIKFINTKDVYEAFEGESGNVEFFKIVQKSDKYSLLVKQVVKLQGGTKPKNTYDEYKPAVFKRAKDKFYLSFDNSKAIKLPTKKKKFYKIFSKKESEIKGFIKKNKLNIKKQKDILKIVDFYTTL
ncbi:MAG: hypothetical protein JXR05_15940 [Flavobacteriaceae bacterium]